MATLSPYIYSGDARNQADFYVGVFGGEIISIQSYGDLPGMEESKKHLVMHLELQALGLYFSWQMLARRQMIEGLAWIWRSPSRMRRKHLRFLMD